MHSALKRPVTIASLAAKVCCAKIGFSTIDVDEPKHQESTLKTAVPSLLSTISVEHGLLKQNKSV